MEHLKQTHFGGLISSATGDHNYQYRTMSVDHFPELQNDIIRIGNSRIPVDSKVYHEYLSEMNFSVPEHFPTARSVLVMAIHIKPMMVEFLYNGERIPVAIPPNYYDAGLTRKMLQDEILNKIVCETGYRIEWMSNRYHLKLLAVRSGLGQYGRNNICYVDDMGSCFTLHVFLTDFQFERDSWSDLQMMELCRNCSICIQQCPLGAIQANSFVIDVNRCLSLYNEIDGVLPDWIPADAHHAVIGCMKCQSSCPANRDSIRAMGWFEEITEEETLQLISENPDKHIIQAIGQKLKIPYLSTSKEMLNITRRNIRAILHSQP